jgi:hypothetical protein
VIEKRNISDRQMNLKDLNSFNRPADMSVNKEAIDILISEGGESFYNYVEWLGLADEPDLIVLSSEHHYYYDPEEMNRFKTIINLKELNQIKNIKTFLQSCLNYLPQKSNFVGCFTDNERVNGFELKYRSSSHNKRGMDAVENGIVSTFPFVNMIYSLMDSRVYNYMTKMHISQLLGEYGFKVIDMTAVSGLTLFHSQKSKSSYN